MSTDPSKSPFERVAGPPLRLLTRFGGSEFAAKLGLRDATERLLHDVGLATGKLMSGTLLPGRLAKISRRRRAATTSAARPDAPPAARADTRPAAPADTSPATRTDTARPPLRLAPVPAGHLFDLAPTEDQEMIRATARRFADEALRPAAAAADKACAPDPDVLAAGHELALASLVVPEAFGGLAETRAAVTVALVAEELARGDLSLALAMLAPIGAASAIVEWGTYEQQARWLPRFTGDTFVGAALAVLEAKPGSEPTRPRTGAVRAPGGWSLHGEKALVPLAETAALFVVLADIRGLGPRLFLVPRATAGLIVRAQPAMGLRGAGLGTLVLDGAFVAHDALLGGDAVLAGDGGFDVAAVIDRARVAWGALAVGGARAVLEYVIPYCNDRKAFGEPITNRQSVAFLIADLAVELEGMRLLVQRAAALADRGNTISREAALVRAQCSAKAMKAGTDGVQLLGGHGFVKEHPVERWYRDLRAIGILEGAVLA